MSEIQISDVRIIKDNPDLPLSFVSDIKEAINEIKSEKGIPYKIGSEK